MFNKIIFLAILFVLSFSKLSYSQKNDNIDNFQSLKRKGLYQRALNYVLDGNFKSDTAVNTVAEILKINEVAKDVEQYYSALRALNKVENNLSDKKNIYITNIINIFKLQYNLSLGEQSKAEKLKKKCAFINNFQISNPVIYNNIADYDKLFSRGKSNKVFLWHNIDSEKDGVFYIDNYYNFIDKKIFLLKKKIVIPQDGVYTFFIGKTGFFDISIDNVKVFKNRDQHGFFPSQYELKVFLSKGLHELSIKCKANNLKKLTFSLQIFDQENSNYDYTRITNNIKKNNEVAPVIQNSGVYMRLDKYKVNSQLENFNTLYVLLGLGLSHMRGAIGKLYRKVDKNSTLYVDVLFYLSLIENDPGNKENYLNKVIKIDKFYLEAYEQLVYLNYKYGLNQKAYDLISMIKKITPFSPIYLKLKHEMLLKLNWHSELANLSSFEKNFDGNFYLRTKIKLLKEQKRYHELYQALREYLIYDRYNFSYDLQLFEAATYCLNMKAQLNILDNLIAKYPSRINLYQHKAKIYLNHKKPKAALAVLSGAYKKSPFNSYTCFLMSLTYTELQKDDLSKYYLVKAIKEAPENSILKHYEELHLKKSTVQKNIFPAVNISKKSLIADKYKNEAAVILCNDTSFELYEDGTYLKRVRKIYKVFNSQNVQNLYNQRIIFDANAERIISFKSSTLIDGVESDSGLYYNQPLSDPQSRLYYNYYARNIKVPRIKNNSILILDYTIRSRQSKIMNGYFGDQVYFDDQYRSLISRVQVIVPKKKLLTVKVLNAKNKKVQEKFIKNKRVYLYTIKNIASRKREKNMQPYFNRVPSVIFSSFSNWKQFYNWYYSLMRSQIVLNDSIKNDLKFLIKDNFTKIDKIKSIYNYVTNRNRYVGFELGIGSYKPRRTDVTYSSRLGDCKDTALLLMAMYNYVGIDSKFVLMRTASTGKPYLDIPYAGNFNHAICYVGYQGGLFLDGTVKNGGIFELPANDRDIDVMVIDKKGFKFKNTAHHKYHKNVDKVKTIINISRNGTALLKRTLLKKGNIALAARPKVDNVQYQINDLNQYWNSKYPAASIKNYHVIENNREKPLQYTYDVEIPQFVNLKSEMFLPVSLFSMNFFKNFAAAKYRYNDFFFLTSQNTLLILEYNLADQFKIYDLPKNKEFKYKKNKIKFKYSKKTPQTIVISVEINLEKGLYKKRNYQKFRKFLLKIETEEKNYIRITKR